MILEIPGLDLISDNPAIIVGLAVAGFTFTWLTGWGGYLGNKGSLVVTWTSQALFLAAISIAAAVYFFGATGGIAIVGAIMWHEWGHVIAYRVAGHSDARFRLIPLLGGVAISNQRPRNHAAECFVVLMGPGFSVCLVVILMLAATWLRDAGLPFSREVRWAAVLTGTINAFNMLPLWPLDGGRALRSITITAAPRLAPMLTMVMSAVLVGFALIKQMWFLLMFAVMGYSYAQRAGAVELHLSPMTGPQALLAALGYLAILGAHLVAGLPLVLRLLRI